MPRLTSFVPKYSKHQTGQASVTISSEKVYLGVYGSKESKEKYDRVIAEWLASGREQAPTAKQGDTTIIQLVNRYRKRAKNYYRKNGEVTREYGCSMEALKVVVKLYGRTAANDFGPLALEVVRDKMIKAGWSRKYINKQVDRIRRCFKFGVQKQLVRPELHHGLMALDGLKIGRSEAKECAPILPVDEITVDATLPFLSPIVADMIRLQRLTGSRPQDVCNLRPCDVDTSNDVWVYRPWTHKNEHAERDRIVMIGPKAQDILRQYLLRDKEAYCFVPAEAEAKRREAQHEGRKTPLSCGNKPGSNRKCKPKRTAGEQYTTDSYRRAIHRACDRAFRPDEPLDGDALKAWQKQHRWSPNRLRHSAGTEIRQRYGLEAAQVALGHASADVTQIYAERDLELAAKIMKEVG